MREEVFTTIIARSIEIRFPLAVFEICRSGERNSNNIPERLALINRTISNLKPYVSTNTVTKRSYRWNYVMLVLDFSFRHDEFELSLSLTQK